LFFFFTNLRKNDVICNKNQLWDKQTNDKRTTSERQATKMTNYELVMELVLEHDDAFKELTFQQTKNLILTTKKATMSKNVMRMHRKYTAFAIYNDIYHYIMDIVNAVYYSKKRNTPHVNRIQRECDDCLDSVYNLCLEDAELKDCLARIINADYRDALYRKYYEIVTDDFLLLYYDLCEEIYIKKLGICDVENYKHEPTHYMFTDGYPYIFYDELEKDGVSNIYHMYTLWQAQIKDGIVYETDTDSDYNDD